ncbi:hypothetical protein N7481_011432 [Penicillium waksmanii]|uniref:uncharacterized protein n=1 Tax=Penicillium waksmanii TaxID=69791 RepID=UPI0025492A2F|nr:uncharacterized protein N7481_011432 [Penicillium waksmanii]KAJ5974222.1 hypothetical protein N7481_011432 [Penicillium waksmanii]
MSVIPGRAFLVRENPFRDQYTTSFFERLHRNGYTLGSLSEQLRMIGQVAGMTCDIFYDGSLRSKYHLSDRQVARKLHALVNKTVLHTKEAIFFISTEGSMPDEENHSRRNTLFMKVGIALCRLLLLNKAVKPSQAAIFAPYEYQRYN